MRALEASLAFEKWVGDMKKKLELVDPRELVVTFPNGAKAEFDLDKPAEKLAYEDTIEKIGRFKEPIIVQKQVSATTPHEGSRYRLLDLFESYKVAKRKVFAQASQNAYFPRIQKFIEHFQARGVIYIDEIHKPEASDYREMVINAQDSPLTVDNYTKSVKGYFDFAIQSGKYPFENPFANLHLVKKSDRAKHTDSWLPYTKDEIQRLFVGEFEAYKKRFPKPDLFFAPLIALTMGLRVGEIAQLYVNDVYQENGIWLLDVNENGPDKKVKYPSSIRKIPLPSQFLQTNFLEYHALIKAKYGEASLLFPYLIKTASNGYSKNIVTNWGKYKTALIKIDTDQKSFHSLRKNVGAGMVDLLVDLALRKRILGHSMSGDITQEVYGKEFSLENIRSVLESLNWGFDFSKFQFKFKSEHALGRLVNSKAIHLRREAARKEAAKKAKQ
ncbi:hypothetical protein GCM10010975_29880 [Comamonas phosphati]|nr:hypothetical protein GCM10010975_29880 [Comamonas phosphati]